MDPQDLEADVTLLDALPHKAWLAGADGDVWYMNSRACVYLGESLERLREVGWSRSLHPEDAAPAEGAWLHAVATGEPYETEFRCQRHDGAYRWQVARGAPMRDAAGTITGWVGTVTDVHDQRVADEQLARTRRQVDEQLALLDALQEHAPIGLGFLDTDLRLVRANRALVEISGRPLEELLGRSVRELAPDAWEALDQALRRVLDDRETVTDLAVSGPDPHDPSRRRHWSVGYYPVELGGDVLGVGVISEDVTERLERIERLQSSEELRDLAERAGSLGSWENDLRTGQSRWSPGLREVFRIGPEVEPTPETFEACLHPDDRPKFRDEVRRVIRSGEPSTVRYRALRPDGAEAILEARAACDVEEGRVVRVFGTTQDVTERVRRSERVEQIERLLTEAEAMIAMGSFEVALPSGDVLLTPGLRGLLGLGEETELGAADPAPLDVLRTYIHPDDRDRQARDLEHLIATGEMITDRLRLQLPDGRERLLELRGTCYVDADGVPERLVGTALDITERERLRGERVALLERSLTAADHERRRIAEHLHDEAVQALIATMLRLDHAAATGSTEPLARARLTLENAVRSLRLNIMELAPFDLSDEGIEAAVAAYAEQVLEVDGVEVAVQVTLEDEHAIPDDVLLASYQIVREALANVRRHAQASEVTVAIGREDDDLVGAVTDDGVGFSAQVPTRAGHLGTQLMRQRAELVGGEVSIAPRADGPGTTVTWRLPI